MPGAAGIYVPSCGGAFRQAEILSGVSQIIRDITSTSTEAIPLNIVNHPYSIILSQDCDLDLDFRARNGLEGPNNKMVGREKIIPNILLCQVFTAKELYENGKTSKEINSTLWDRIKTNSDVRYHFCQAAEAELDATGLGLPELAIDFKRYFAIPVDDLYMQLQHSLDPKSGLVQRRLRLKSPYCEHFCTRFSFYLSRVALPDPHLSE